MAHGMSDDRSNGPDVELIIVTDDRAHAQSVRDSLSTGRYRYATTHLDQRETLVADFEAAVEDVRGKRPVIVFLDCAFLAGNAETFAARVLKLRSAMAIECVATRPPDEHHRRMCLRMLGASLFDGLPRRPEVVPLH